MKKLGYNLTMVGLGILAISFVWFLVAVGGKPGENAVHCLYSNSVECQIAWGVLSMMGETAYNYLSFWAGVATTAFGIILQLSDGEKDVQSNS